MSIEVLTYDNPSSLLTHKIDYLENTIHVCATSNLAHALSELSEQKNKSDKSVILSMNKFSNTVYPNWFSDETLFTQSIELIDFLNKYEHKEKVLFDSYKRNKEDLLNTLRLIYFSNIDVKDIADVIGTGRFTQKEAFLPAIYEWFAQLQLDQLRSMPVSFDKDELIAELKNKKKGFTSKNPTIIFHGFYFITPEQQQIMEFIKSLEFNIVFLLYYKQEFPKRCSFITKFINKNNGWRELDEWVHLKGDDTLSLGDTFLSIFDNKELSNLETKKIDKYEFSNFTDFLSHVERNKYLSSEESDDTKKVIMTTNSKYMNNRMQEFYPERYKSIRNFLKYPLGYLLINLHELWNIENADIRANVEQVGKLLGTRYFFSDKNEEYFLEVFSDLTSYFVQCEKKDEWEKQFEKLISLRTSIEANFQYASPFIDKYHPSFELDFNESPYSYLPYLSIGSENLIKIKNKVLAIFELAESLFDNERREIDLNLHFKKLIGIINNSKSNYSVDVLDTDILDELLKKLNMNINIDEVNKDYISDAIRFYLSGSANEDTENLIEPLINIDGELFRDRKLHITGLDEKGLPYGEYVLPWPLSKLFINELSKKNKYLSLLLHRNDSIKDMTRYLLSIMFEQYEKIELSHIQNYDDNIDLESSFYIDLMEEHIDKKKSFDLDFNRIVIDSIDLEQTFDISNYSDDKKAEFIFYPTRLLYSMASKQTYYESEFQHKFVLSKLATYLLINNADEKIIKSFLMDLFPQIDELSIELKLENSIAGNFPTKSANRFHNSTHKINDYRKLFLYPSLKWDKVDDLYSKAEDVSIINNKSFENVSLEEEFIYPYLKIEYPKNIEGEDNDAS